MKSVFAAALLFVGSAFAQGISVAIPAEGDTVMAGQSTDVELDFPVSASFDLSCRTSNVDADCHSLIA